MAGDRLSLAEKASSRIVSMCVPSPGLFSLCRDKSFCIFNLGWGLGNLFFFCKSKIVNVLGFAGHPVSAATVRFCQCRMKELCSQYGEKDVTVFQ